MNNKRIAAIAAAAVMVGGLSFGAYAEAPDEASYVYFIAEKSVIGQGLTVEPVKVELKAGEKGIDIVKKCAEIEYTDGDWGPYITAFKDTDTGAEVPEIIKEVCPEWGTRSKEGYLSAYDYTAESGWSYFVNDEYAMSGIGDYEPQSNDVIRFSFTVYGYGADLGVDNSGWGGAAALITPPEKAELTRLAADCEDKDSDAYKTAVSVLGDLTADKAAVDEAVKALKDSSEIGKSDEISEPESSDTESSDVESSEVESSIDDTKGDDDKGDASSEESKTDDSSAVIGDTENNVPPTGVGLSVTATAITALIAVSAFAVLKKKNV